MAKRGKTRRQEPQTDWERLLKSKVIAFEIEKLSPGMKAARWVAGRDPKSRHAYTYQLPKR